MAKPVIIAENLAKKFQLGNFGGNTFRDSVMRKLNIFSKSEQNEKDVFWALQDVSFELEKGNVLGIIGKNGAGKSTLLKILSRITYPTHGKFTINGRVSSLLEVGTGFHPELTGRENIYLNGTILGMSRQEVKAKFDDIVAFSEVEKFLDTPVKRYSSGMYVRLAFSVAAHLEPEILIIDEVLAVGDHEFQKKCLGKMGEVAGEGRTVIFVSHNMASVKTLCNQAILLNRGHVQSMGPTAEIISDYFNINANMAKTGTIPKDMTREYGLGYARFIKLYVTDENNEGQPKSQLMYHERLLVRIIMEADKTIEDAIIFLQVYSEDGTQVAFCESSHQNDDFQAIEKGETEYLVQLDTQLLPGKYFLGGSICHSNGYAIEYIEKAFEFNVLSNSANAKSDYRWNSSHGFIFDPGKWVKR